MSFPQPFCAICSSRGVDDREVGLSLLRERRRERNQNRVGVAQLVVVGRGVQSTLVHEALEGLGRHVLDIALAAVQFLHTLGVPVDEQHRAARLREHLRERDADVAGSDNGDVGHRRGIVQRGANLGPAERGGRRRRLQSFAAGR